VQVGKIHGQRVVHTLAGSRSERVGEVGAGLAELIRGGGQRIHLGPKTVTQTAAAG
jgi:hypothetical protein